jgi:hypothetical protein
MHTRLIAAALMSALEEIMSGPEDIPHIVSSADGTSGNIKSLAGVHNEGSFRIVMEDGCEFRVDVIRVG